MRHRRRGHRDYKKDAFHPICSEGPGRRLPVLAAMAAVAFAVGLAVVVGQRLTPEAISVLAGAACGVGAAVPTSLLMVWVVMRRRREQQAPDRSQPSYPPVVVVQPPAAQHPSQFQPDYLPPYVAPRGQRQFTVVGGDVEDPDR